MKIKHHPDDELLLSHVTGSLALGMSLVVASHVEACAHCAERVQVLNAVGGALLEDLPPALLSPQALAKTLAAIDQISRPAPTTALVASSPLPALPYGMAAWPQTLRACTASRWRWIGPGMHWSRVMVPGDVQAKVFLFRIAAGKSLAFHSHSGIEVTQILHGAYNDSHQTFGTGDFDLSDGGVHHEPLVQAPGDCVCLAAVSGQLRFHGTVANLVGRLMHM